jgi:addiction module HigA family antidote
MINGGYVLNLRKEMPSMSKSSTTIRQGPAPGVALKIRPVHPGEILAEELQELELSANALAQALDVPTNRISDILRGRRSVTADTALRLARYLGTTPALWLNLQQNYDLAIAQKSVGAEIAKTVRPRKQRIAA